MERPVTAPAVPQAPAPDHVWAPAGPLPHGRRQGSGPAHARSQRSARSAVLSALIGFVCGAVCWHLVGFWGFIQHIVLKGPPEQVASETSRDAAPPAEPAAARPRTRLAGIAASAASTEVAGCTALVRDPTSGSTRAIACLGPLALVWTNPLPRRDDLVVSALARTAAASESEAWAMTISQD